MDYEHFLALFCFNKLNTIDQCRYFVYTLYILELEVNGMYTSIQKWGNSQAIRLPKGILEAASLQENDKVEIKVENDCIIIRRVKKQHKTIEERIAEYSGDYICGEWDTGKPQGKEVW